MIKKDFPAQELPAISPATPKSRIKKTVDEYLDAVIIIIIVGIVATIICAFLVDFRFTAEINWKDFTADTLVVTVCTASLYILLRSLTMRKGRRTDMWVTAHADLEEGIDNIFNNNLSAYTTAYCREWEQAHLRESRAAVLDLVGITVEEYEEKYLIYSKRELKEKYPDLTDLQFKCIMRAKRVRKCHYNPNYLISRHDTQAKYAVAPSERMSAAAKNRIYSARTVINCIITSGFSVGLFSDLIFNYSTEALIACIIKLAITAVFGVYGMVTGYNFATKTEVEEMQSRTDEIGNFIKWYNKKEHIGGNLGVQNL